MRYFLERLDASPDLRAIRARICAIGPATREALERFHLKVDVMAEQYVAEGLLEALAGSIWRAARILIARAAVARDLSAERTGAARGGVDVVEAYRTSAPPGLPTAHAEILAAQAGLDHVHQFLDSGKSGRGGRRAALRGVRIASIGPVTTATLRKNGIETNAEASVFTIGGLVDAILKAGIIG